MATPLFPSRGTSRRRAKALRRAAALLVLLVAGATLGLRVAGHPHDSLRRTPRAIPEAVAHSRLLGRLMPTKRLTVEVVLTARDHNGLDNAIRSVNDPRSRRYGNYLTRREVGARFGQPVRD